MTVNPRTLLLNYRFARRSGLSPKYARMSAYMRTCDSRTSFIAMLDKTWHYWKTR